MGIVHGPADACCVCLPGFEPPQPRFCQFRHALQEIDPRTLVFYPYEVGSVLTLRSAIENLKQSDDETQLLRVRIKKLQQPWTLSCCMLVDVLSDCSDRVKETAFLKLFDWRFAAQQRSDQGVDPWTEETAAKYAKFAVSREAEKFLEQLKENQYQETDENWSIGQDETFLVRQTLNMYDSETAVYKRL